MKSDGLVSVNWYLGGGICFLVLGVILTFMHLKEGNWINMIPLHSAPVFAGIMFIFLGILAVIMWFIFLARGVKRAKF